VSDTEVKALPATPAARQMAEAELKKRILENLAALGGQVSGEDTIVYEGTGFRFPASFEGDLAGVMRHLDEVRRSEEKKIVFKRMFPYRMMDGAVAFSRAMSELFGAQGIGMVTRTMFGDIPPEIQSVETGIGEHTEAPWGKVGFTALDAVFTVKYTSHPELGYVSEITCEAPRKHRRKIEGFFDVVEAHLRNNSIYRGKAITAASTPGFFNAFSVRPESVVYTPAVMRQLSANVWTHIRYAQQLRDMNRSLKRTVLLKGPYGTGKSLAGVLTAQIALEHGWTFIIVRSEDDPLQALQTAKMYAPAVVFIEDFELLTEGKSREEVDRILDLMDSVSTKGQEVIGLLTTNFLEKIDKAALRPGRIDHIISIEGLEGDGYTTLVKSIIPAAQLAADVNYQAVAEAFKGFYPAFASEAAGKAILYSLDRTGGRLDTITTEDLLAAAAGVREQLEVQQAAHEASHRQPGIDELLVERMENVLRRTMYEGDYMVVQPRR